MRGNPLLLVFDAGTGSARCLVLDVQGKLVVKKAAPWRYHNGPRTTFDPQEWWAESVKLGRAALAEVNPAQVVAISATSQRQGFVAFDQAGREFFGWPNLDRSVSSNLTEETADRLYEMVGRWPGTVHTAPRLASEPAVHSFLPISDWLLYRLSGVKAIEPNQAAESCLFNIHQNDWSPEAVRAFSLEDRQLPVLYSSGTVLGKLSSGAARELGLPARIPVVVGGADTQCGTLGCGAVEPGTLALIAGTSGPLQLCLDRPLVDPERRTITGPHLLPGQWVLESNAMFTGLSFARLRDLIAPGMGYAEINQAMAAVGPQFTGLPFCIGSSIMDSRKGSILPWGGMFFPLPFGEYEPLTLLRAALESAAFAVRANLEQLERVSGQAFRPDTLLVMGGGAAQGFWPQLVADSLRKKVMVAREAEVSGLGAAMCAATGAEIYPSLSTAARSMAHPGNVIEPRPVKNLEIIYRRWQAAYEGLAGLNLS